jgi:hypothetical protein
VKENKKFTGILVFVALAIWGVIAFQLYQALELPDDGDNLNAVQSRRPQGGQTSVFSYRRDVRDPFAYHVAPAPRKDKIVPTTTPKPAWAPPPLKLTGILESGRKQTAMLESPDGAVHFLKEGDTLRGVKLVRIGHSSVKYFFQKKRDEWILPAN